MNITINVADDLYRRASEVAEAENVPVEQLFASAFEQKLLEFERLKEKAASGSYGKFLAVMSKIPATDPPEYDQL
jgi:hypothetical protein